MSDSPSIVDPERFAAAIRRFDEENAGDPNREVVDGQERPREWLYAQRLTDWVLRLQPDASEPLRLAARCQHLCRWMIPRESYPMTRPGYLKWREELKKFHAGRAGRILLEVGYPEDIVQRVHSLNLKRDLAHDADCQTLEDALCLVFLEFQFVELARKTDDARVINALQKSWRKMSSRARALALSLSYPPREKELLTRALREEPTAEHAAEP